VCWPKTKSTHWPTKDHFLENDIPKPLNNIQKKYYTNQKYKRDEMQTNNQFLFHPESNWCFWTVPASTWDDNHLWKCELWNNMSALFFA
jgi:hypothetical protein